MNTANDNHISRLLTLFLLPMLMLLSGGCTRNNGDIGDWFGNWQIMEMQADGQPDDDYSGQFFLEFQNNIVKIIWVAPDGYAHSIYYCFGTWKELSDNSIEMDFTQSDDTDKAIYKPFERLKFPYDRPFTLSVSDGPGNNRTLTFTDQASSVTYSYIIRKR